eukprot:4584376-Pleurochrysis_carterae.AAC.1
MGRVRTSVHFALRAARLRRRAAVKSSCACESERCCACGRLCVRSGAPSCATLLAFLRERPHKLVPLFANASRCCRGSIDDELQGRSYYLAALDTMSLGLESD